MYIAVAGNIGSGKTTLTSMLARHYSWDAEYEAVDYNPYLADFYKDMERWAFPLQVYFLNSRFRQNTHIAKSTAPVIQDRTIYEDAYIFAANLYKSKLLSERDYQTYLNLFHSMLEYAKAPDLLIYLRAGIPKLLQQIRKRGRHYEKAISPDYLLNLNAHYEEWIAGYNPERLLVVDVNHLDFQEKAEDFVFVARGIDEKLKGLSGDGG